jgi:lysozyme
LVYKLKMDIRQIYKVIKKIPIARIPVQTTGQRRRLGKVLLVFLVLYALYNPTFWYSIISIFDYPFHYKEYKHFGIRVPSGFSVHGIDVSRYQSKIDWDRVKKMKVGDIGITFAFIKATEGSWLKDRYFDSNWENAKKNGVIRGAYHFFRPNVSPKLQAINFEKVVSLRSGDLPPVVDVEEEYGMNKQQIQRYTKEFLRILETRYKVKPILYTNRDFYKTYFADNPDFEGYRIWIAHYHVTSLSMPDDNKWQFWQHSDRGNVSGINEKVDFNVFNGEISELRKLCIP